jgi:hypothetical protein
MSQSPLSTLARSLLSPLGFTMAKGGRKFTRIVGTQHQCLRLTADRSGNKEWSADIWSRTDETDDSSGHALSPSAPFKGSWSWPSAPYLDTQQEYADTLRRQALPYFESMARGVDPAASHAAVHDRLAALVEATPAFTRQGHSYWRRRGEVFDVVDTEFLADDVFCLVYASVWHTGLPDGLGANLPEDISRVASTTLGLQAMDATPGGTLFHAAAVGNEALPLRGAPLAATLLAHFERIVSRDDVLAQVRPVFRPYVTVPE